MNDAMHLLLPRPHEAVLGTGGLRLPDRPILSLATPQAEPAARRLKAALGEFGLHPTATRSEQPSIVDDRGANGLIRLEITDSGIAESYSLAIEGEGIRLRGADPAGLSHGVSTLVQWLRIHSPSTAAGERVVPALRVEDRPDFRHRGVLLDISRNKVPSLETLRRLIDGLAGWKINQLQLYMEHTFAYPDHRAVWQGASPLSGADVRELDTYCRVRGIELVPNQNSFGHFHRWLVHEPYRRLAENPEGIEHPFSFEREPFSLCPTDPGSVELLADLYDQLLPNFSSPLFNVGLDETFDLGQGRSAEACAERGKGKVYLEFLRRVHALVSERGRRMQFWGDVILQHPELLDQLPNDAIALEWGYDAGHPFAEDTHKFRASGLDYYVCPGTSSWNSFAGRTRNAIANLAEAAIQGQANGAKGYLITDWGDNGHLQPLPVSYPGLAAGAAFAWNTADARDPRAWPLDQLLDLHAFRDEAGVMGRLTTRLGDVYREINPECANGSALFFLLVFAYKARQERRGEGLSVATLERSRESIDEAIAPLAASRMQGDDAATIRDEMEWVADTLRYACDLGTAWVEEGEDRPLDALPEPQRRPLARRMSGLIARHREIWLARNRPGGLDDSAAHLKRLRRLLEG
ncbi:MAG: family 20 glycosylhydrolase [Acidobacteriota bacterium]